MINDECDCYMLMSIDYQIGSLKQRIFNYSTQLFNLEGTAQWPHQLEVLMTKRLILRHLTSLTISWSCQRSFKLQARTSEVLAKRKAHTILVTVVARLAFIINLVLVGCAGSAFRLALPGWIATSGPHLTWALADACLAQCDRADEGLLALGNPLRLALFVVLLAVLWVWVVWPTPGT
jgi:hypothetical protein